MIFKGTNLVRTSYFPGNVEEKVLELLEKFVTYKIFNTLKLFWCTVDSSVLLNEGVQFFFHDICHFFVCIADCTKLYKMIIKKVPYVLVRTSMKIILLDPNLEHKFFGNNFFDPNYGAHL